MLPGVGRWPIPCAEAKGLFPGRGPVGRCPIPCAEENGLLPGRGAPGFGAPPSFDFGAAGPGVAAAGAAGSAGASAAGAATGASGAGAGLGPGLGPGVGAPEPGFAAAGVAASEVSSADFAAPGLAAPGLAAPGLAAGFAAAAGAASPDDFREASDSMAARSLRATGGSMVEEGLLTNSPSSLSFASAILLSTPSSAAISCTRGLPATILLSGVGPPRQGRPLVADGSHFEPFTLFP